MRASQMVFVGKICMKLKIPTKWEYKKMWNVNNWESIITTLLSFFKRGTGRKNCTPQNYCSSFMCTCIPCISWLFHFFWWKHFPAHFNDEEKKTKPNHFLRLRHFCLFFRCKKSPKLHLKTNNFKVVNICQAIMVASPHSTQHIQQ